MICCEAFKFAFKKSSEKCDSINVRHIFQFFHREKIMIALFHIVLHEFRDLHAIRNCGPWITDLHYHLSTGLRVQYLMLDSNHVTVISCTIYTSLLAKNYSCLFKIDREHGESLSFDRTSLRRCIETAEKRSVM